MKRRYLKIGALLIWATDNLTKEDLIRAKTKQYDFLIDLDKWLRYDVDKNTWVEIEGD